MGIDISVIMPTYNKYPLNLLTLYSLENQTYPAERYEVILVDDGSTDATPDIALQHTFTFPFRYIRLPRNTGRPAARNEGIRQAKGKWLVFLDAEVLTEPGFVESHAALHSRERRLVAEGVLTMKGVYSSVSKDFNPKQMDQLMQLLGRYPSLLARYWQTAPHPDPVPLFGREDIHAGAYRGMAIEKPYERHYEEEILQRHGDRFEGFLLPWLSFYTGNVSVSRDTFDKHGLFEEFDGYGWDDLEMGYRLFKSGYRFAHIRHPFTYHQEHPVSAAITGEEEINFFKFQQKYREIDMMVLLFCYLPNPLRIHEINLTLKEIHDLKSSAAPERSNLIIGVVGAMLEAVGYLRRFRLPVANLLTHAGISMPSPGFDRLRSELEWLHASGRYTWLLRAIDRLTSL